MWCIPVEQQFFSLDFPSDPAKHAEFTAGPFDRRIKKGLAKPYYTNRLLLCYGCGSRPTTNSRPSASMFIGIATVIGLLGICQCSWCCSTPQLKTSTLFILVSPLIPEHRSLGTRSSVFI